jgi:hypothetical protein
VTVQTPNTQPPPSGKKRCEESFQQCQKVEPIPLHFMTGLSARLSARGLSRIAQSQFKENFSFILGHDRIVCDSLIADFLSPKLAQLHSVDPTVPEYRVTTQVSKQDFEEFVSLGYGSAVKLRKDQVLCYSQLFREFENPELCKLISHYLTEPSTNENVLEKIRLRELHKEKCQKELEFAASQFYQIPIDQLRRADANLLYSILSQSSLKIESEDLLFSFLVDRSQRNQSLSTCSSS